MYFTIYILACKQHIQRLTTALQNEASYPDSVYKIFFKCGTMTKNDEIC